MNKPEVNRVRPKAVSYAIAALSLGLAACGGANEEDKAKAAALTAAQSSGKATMAAASSPSAGDPLAETTRGPSAVTEAPSAEAAGGPLAPSALPSIAPQAIGGDTSDNNSNNTKAGPTSKALGLSSTCTINQVKTFGNYCAAPAVGVIGNASSRTFMNTKAGYTGSITASCFLGFVSWSGATCDAAVAAAPNPAPKPVPVVVPPPPPALVVAPPPSPNPAAVTAPPSASAIQAAVDAGLDALAPSPMLSTAANMKSLTYAATNPTATSTGIGASNSCRTGYTAPSTLVKTNALPLPSNGGVFYTRSELEVWRKRIASGPFVKANDYTQGSPGDWARIEANAKSFGSKGETTITATSSQDTYGNAGTLARDAAFAQLVTGDTSRSDALRRYLLAQTSNLEVDFASNLCMVDKAGWVPDAWFYQATWLMRYIVTYDFIRAALPEADRVKIENFIRRNAYFFAAHTNLGLEAAFPKRSEGNYAVRRENAAATTEKDMWWSKRYDTNGDCKVDDKDAASARPVYAYVKADGTLGPRISVLSQYYNNRRSIVASTFGTAGVLLADPELISSGKRYFMEWLAYGVWPDGSQGEYARNGDYCISSQGVIYAAANIQGATSFARVLARQGDRSLVDYSTTDGLFGTQSTGGAPAKTLESAVSTYLKLLSGPTPWYFHNPAIAQQDYSANNLLGNTVVRYMNSTKAADDFHELGLLPAAALFPKLPIAGVVMRDKSVTAQRFPGATGNPVPTGYGNWTDYINALPAAFLLRP